MCFLIYGMINILILTAQKLTDLLHIYIYNIDSVHSNLNQTMDVLCEI